MSTAADLRFYDPRVLRAVLSGAEPRHAQYFFGAAKRYFVESQIPGHLFEFNWTDKKASATQIRLCESMPKTPPRARFMDFWDPGRAIFAQMWENASRIFRPKSPLSPMTNSTLPCRSSIGTDSSRWRRRYKLS
ncbi:MAG: hypothetical protein IPJ30_02140 [Acidobacteria bacterium]|nr:hypothetical protein [Acidobacteriota bacterium]